MGEVQISDDDAKGKQIECSITGIEARYLMRLRYSIRHLMLDISWWERIKQTSISVGNTKDMWYMEAKARSYVRQRS